MPAHPIIGILLVFAVIVAVAVVVRMPAVQNAAQDPIFRAILSSFGIKPGEEVKTSPYEGKIMFDFVSLGVSGAENTGAYVRLRMEGVADEYINVTGWTLHSSKMSVQIPEARDLNTVPDVYGNIFLRKGSVLTIYVGESPTGENRRMSPYEWSVWLEKPFLSYPHGALTLVDREGRKVGAYSY